MAALLTEITIVSSRMLLFLRSTGAFLAEGPFPSVVFAAIISYYVGRYVAFRSPWPRRLGLLMFLAVCLDGFLKLEERVSQFGPYIVIGFRAFLALLIVEGASGLVFSLIVWVWSHAAGIFRTLGSGSIIMGSRVRRALTPAPAPPPPPPPPPPPLSLKERIDLANQEYEATSTALRSAGLDDDALEFALLQAQQKRTRRIHEELKR